MGRWGDGEMGSVGRWGDGEMGRWGVWGDGRFFYAELRGFDINNRE
ncbi:MAG: hypothetical protein F6K24_06010 [Okeania sp. SIO2D1]|nr:hypothetical protein [Okeania sp. SIO2D1]